MFQGMNYADARFHPFKCLFFFSHSLQTAWDATSYMNGMVPEVFWGSLLAST